MLRATLVCAILAMGCSAFDSGRLKPPRDPSGPPDAQITEDASTPRMDASMPDGGASDAAVDAGGDAAGDAELEGGSSDGAVDASADTGTDTGVGLDCGTPDCVDGCPDDPNKSGPGVCGCGLADTDPGEVTCNDLRGALVHRYPFNGAGVTVNDVQGSANGLLIGASLAGTGVCTIEGGTSEDYVDLPNGILSALTNATIEVWVAWDGVGDWTRIFDFGNTTMMPEGSQGTGSTMLFLTPRYVGAGGVMRLVYSLTSSTGQTTLDATTVLPSDGVHHVAAVIDDTGNTMRLYLDGQLEGSTAFTGTLGGISDINNWLGRSQYNADPELGGTLHEARIYNAALTDEQIAFSFAQGTDPGFLE